MTEPLTIRQRITDAVCRYALHDSKVNVATGTMADDGKGQTIIGWNRIDAAELVTRILVSLSPEGVPYEDFGRWKSVEERGPQNWLDDEQKEQLLTIMGGKPFPHAEEPRLMLPTDPPQFTGPPNRTGEPLLSSDGSTVGYLNYGLDTPIGHLASRVGEIEGRLSPPRHPDWGSEEEGSARDPWQELVDRVDDAERCLTMLEQRARAFDSKHEASIHRDKKINNAIEGIETRLAALEQYPRLISCAACHGRGKDLYAKPNEVCQGCNGRGVQTAPKEAP